MFPSKIFSVNDDEVLDESDEVADDEIQLIGNEGEWVFEEDDEREVIPSTKNPNKRGMTKNLKTPKATLKVPKTAVEQAHS